jgi:hypothetical protein
MLKEWLHNDCFDALTRFCGGWSCLRTFILLSGTVWYGVVWSGLNAGLSLSDMIRQRDMDGKELCNVRCSANRGLIDHSQCMQILL